MTTINELSTQINFAASSHRIQGKSVKEALIEIKILLDDNPDGNLIIEGHTRVTVKKMTILNFLKEEQMLLEII